MKNKQWLLMITIITALVFSQTTHAQITVPGHTISRATKPGTILTTTIKNTDSVSANFFMRYNHPNREYISLSDSALRAYLLTQITVPFSDVENARLQAVQAVLKLLKSIYFENMQRIWTASGTPADRDSINARKICLMGTLASQQKRQCGDYVASAKRMLMLTGLFSSSMIRNPNIPGHAVLEWLYRGSFIMTDFDPGQPCAFVKKATNLNGYASAAEIANDTTLIAERYTDTLFTGQEIDLCPMNTLYDYKVLWSNAPINYDSMNTTLVDTFAGDIELCAGCSMTFEFKVGAVVDTSENEGYEAYHTVFGLQRRFKETHDWVFMDSVIQKMADYLNISYADAFAIWTSSDPLFIINGTTDPFIMGINEGLIPRFKITIPARQESIQLGRDLKLPCLLLGVQSTDTLLIDGKTILPGFHEYQSELWGDGVSPQPLYENIHYVQQGEIPENTDAVLFVAYNMRAWNWMNGLVIDQFGNPNALQITLSEDGIPLSVPLVSKTKDFNTLSIYPNPSTGSCVIQSSVDIIPEDVHIYDLRGSEVGGSVLRRSNQAVEISIYTKGLYIVECKGLHGKVVIQ